jgi:hypothetical protein
MWNNLIGTICSIYLKGARTGTIEKKKNFSNVHWYVLKDIMLIYENEYTILSNNCFPTQYAFFSSVMIYGFTFYFVTGERMAWCIFDLLDGTQRPRILIKQNYNHWFGPRWPRTVAEREHLYTLWHNHCRQLARERNIWNSDSCAHRKTIIAD